jgi:DNA repair ATPase RecN
MAPDTQSLPEFTADVHALEIRLNELLESEKTMKAMASDQAIALAEIDRLTQVLRTQATQLEVTQKALDEQMKRTLELEAANAAAATQVEELNQKLQGMEERFHSLRLRHLRQRSR